MGFQAPGGQGQSPAQKQLEPEVGRWQDSSFIAFQLWVSLLPGSGWAPA